MDSLTFQKRTPPLCQTDSLHSRKLWSSGSRPSAQTQTLRPEKKKIPMIQRSLVNGAQVKTKAAQEDAREKEKERERERESHLVRDLRSERHPGPCSRADRFSPAWRPENRGAHACTPPHSNSPKPRQETRRPDFPRFLWERAETDNGKRRH